MNNFKKFDGYKFRQAMAATTTPDFRGEDWELQKEQMLETASADIARMWRHIWQKLAQKVGTNND